MADFGLALREQDVGKGARFAGTPAYTSPEQARGEGHRIDGRSDLFSLGVVFYELLAGRRPFKAATIEGVLEQVIHSEVRPPRQTEDSIPKELERICLKALSKRASDRYTTGKDMANDLRHFFQKTTEEEKVSLRSRIPTDGILSPTPASTPVLSALPTPTSDRAVVWNARSENRQLPSLLQWWQIGWLTHKKNWTAPQRKMMRRARGYHALRGLAVAGMLLVLVVAGLMIRSGVVEQQKATHAEGLVHRLLDADIAQVPGIISEIEPNRQWGDRRLRDEQDRAAANSREKLHTSLALLSVDPVQVDYLYGRLLGAAPNEVPVIRDFLVPHKDKLLDKLWTVTEKPEEGKASQRLRAAAALAKYDPEGERWGKAGALVVNDLILENPVFLGQWSEAFRPVKNRLLPQLSEIFRDHQPERTAERSLATNDLAELSKRTSYQIEPPNENRGCA